MINYLVAAILIIAVALKASSQTASNCGEVGTTGDSNNVFLSLHSKSRCNILIGLSSSLCQDVYGAI